MNLLITIILIRLMLLIFLFMFLIVILQVITSKQRPRKLCMKGSSGKEYMFLLKGHEDLRQDERVMQFFSLVNSLLTSDPETLKRNLTIQVIFWLLFLMLYYGFCNYCSYNSVLSTPALRRHFQRFSVVPLSTNSGLIGWVPQVLLLLLQYIFLPLDLIPSFSERHLACSDQRP